MKTNQLTQGQSRRVMYVENKNGLIDGVAGRIGWVTFSKTGKTVYYRGRTLKRAKGGGIRGNHFDESNGDEYWISGVKIRGTNQHWAKHIAVAIDENAREGYDQLKSSKNKNRELIT